MNRLSVSSENTLGALESSWHTSFFKRKDVRHQIIKVIISAKLEDAYIIAILALKKLA